MNDCTRILLAAMILCAPVTVRAATEDGKLTMSTPLEKRVCRFYFGTPMVKGTRDAPVETLYAMTPEQIADVVADMGTDLWQVHHIKSMKGMFYKSKLAQHDPDAPTDAMLRIIKQAHERGIWVQGSMQLSEPEVLDIKGEMKNWMIHPIAYGDRTWQPSLRWMSFASAGFRAWSSGMHAEAIALTDIDGFHHDGTPFAQRVGWPWPAGDIGPEAAADFKAKTGYDPPQKEDWSSQAFREWVKWRYDTTVEFFEAVTTAAQKQKPHAAVAMIYNMHNVDWHLGLPLRDVSDQSWYPSIHDETSLLGRIGRALSPRAEQWYWSQWHFPSVAWGEMPYFNPDRTMAKALRALAHGTYPSIGGFHVDIRAWKDGVTKVFTELRKRRDYVGGESVKYAALLVSQQTRDYRRDPNQFWLSVEGFNEVQNNANLLTDVIFDDSLTVERLSPYPLLILPNVQCLSDAQCDAIRQYVREGGVLLATLDTSLHDEWGQKRDNFALADLFGVDHVSSGYGTQVAVPQLPAMQEQLGRVVGFESPSTQIKVRDGAELETLFTFASREKLNGVLMMRPEDYDSGRPAIMMRRVGKGAVMYSAYDLGLGYMKHRLPPLADMVAAVERYVAEPPIVIDAAPIVETTAYWRRPNRINVHLVNMTGLSLGQMAPIANITITLNEGRLRGAKTVVAGQNLKVQDNRVTVPAIDYGEVVVLEIE